MALSWKEVWILNTSLASQGSYILFESIFPPLFITCNLLVNSLLI